MDDNWTLLLVNLPDYGWRLGAALLCGILLGIEREARDKPAGLRTIVLITLGSALYMIVSSLIPFAVDWPEEVTRADPSRIASQVVTGIGFLGAGTIILARGSIHGLTTAAVIWVAAGIGLCAGIGFPLIALGITLLVLAALILMNPLRARLARSGRTCSISLHAPDDALVVQRVLFTIDEQDLHTTSPSITKDGERLRIDFQFRGSAGSAVRLLNALGAISGVSGSSFFELQ